MSQDPFVDMDGFYREREGWWQCVPGMSFAGVGSVIGNMPERN